MSVELWKAVFDWAAVILVGLTFIAGAGALITGNVLSNRQDEQLRQFSSDLTKAKTSLAEQQERAATAEGNIALAEQHASEADAKAEGFRLAIAKANEQAASANEVAERERLARLQLEAKLADRVLSLQSKKKLESIAASLPKGTKVDLLMVGQTLEIGNITQSIRQSLEAGGMVGRVWSSVGGAVRGILVGINPTADPTSAKAGEEIAATFTTAGIGSAWKWDDLPINAPRVGPSDPMDAPILIVVGGK